MKKYVPKILGSTFLLVSLWFLYDKLTNLSEASSVLDILSSNLLTICSLSLLYAIGSLFNACGFSMLLPNFSKSQVIFIYLKTMIGKYIPGNIGHFAGRHIYLKKLGGDHSSIIASHANDLFMSLSVAVFCGLFLSLFSELPRQFFPAVSKMNYFLMISALTLVVALVIFYWVPKFFRKSLPVRQKWTNSLPGYLGFFVFSTLSFVLLAHFAKVTPAIDLDFTIDLALAYLIAWIAGFVTVGSPGGIGVREAVLVYLLQSTVEPELLLALALAHRAIAILGEFLGFITGLFGFKVNAT